jgi:protein-S-isoprenylcysteine O-methyltransferase Ste14
MQRLKLLRAALLPVTGAVVVPGITLWLTGQDTFGLWKSNPAARLVLAAFGGASFCLGLVLMVATVWLFATVGHGTPEPWKPPQHLVVRGVYRHVRNPMIAGAYFLLLGEAGLTASFPLLIFVVLVVVINAIYIPLSEEPGLVKRFGEEYEVYRRNVPRWIPRLKAWPADRTTIGQR